MRRYNLPLLARMRDVSCLLLGLGLLLTAGCDGGSHTPAEHGSACGASARCGTGLLCAPDPPFPGGYCTETCAGGVGCTADSVCTLLLGTQVCLARCTSRSDCRDAYQCWMGTCRPDCLRDPESCGSAATCGADGQCVGPECTIAEDCGPGRRCDDGRCMDIPPPVDAGPVLLETGEACVVDEQCTSGICLPPSRGGICSDTCVDSLDCIARVLFDSSCGPVERDGAVASLCVPQVPGGAAMGQVCARDTDCVTNTCEQNRCTAACSMVSDCVLGMTCDDVTHAPGSYVGCTWAPQAAGAITFEEIPLGEFDVRAGFGTSDIRFATPPGSVSVTLLAEQIGGDRLPLSFWQVHDPTDTRIFDLETISMLGDPPIRWIPSETEESIAMLVPNTTTDRLTYQHGLHRVSVLAFSRMMGDTGSVRVRLRALVKRVRGTLSTSAVDLDVFMVGVGITAAAATTNSRVTEMLTRFDAILGAAGVSLGDVTFHDVTGADATRYQVIDTTDGADSELAGLFRLSSRGSGGRRLAVFLVQNIISSRMGFSTLGIAGGIPGPPGIFGTGHSGVVLRFDSGTSGRAAGHVLAHESAHFFGLYHVTESSRPCGAGETPPGCAPWGGTDVIGDTTRGDTANLMNWSIVGGGSNTRISAGQSFVLLRSAMGR